MIEMPPPPPALAAYVAAGSAGDPVARFLREGKEFARTLVSHFPDGLDLHGARVLDFGCGAGRFLRHMINAGTGAAFEGCDIHEPSIAWLAAHLPPPHAAFAISERPPVRRPDGHYRLIYATSVFTHIAGGWADWLGELHRLLDRDGLLIATVMSSGAGVLFEEDPWEEDRIGMLVLGPGNPWEAGGPMVLHSEWWLRAHWGRAFEIVSFDGGEPGDQGFVVMRRRDARVTPDGLRAIDPREPRELGALGHALERAHAEAVVLNTRHDEYSRAYQQEAAAREDLRQENDALRRRAAELERRLDAAGRELVQARRARQAARTIARAVAGRTRLLVGRGGRRRG